MERAIGTTQSTEFKDYLDEISAETKYLSTISRLVKKETGPDARDRIRRRILQAAEDTGVVYGHHIRTKQFNESLFIKYDFKPKKAKVFLFNECALNVSNH
ncbi:hypothetical protein PROFUN_09734 [Planoprotostelium fungivorum]|uniref:Uncharacterized protein n=1 Tax=Planoprotostelium fungivorum TaxID=1890364 RepID=A0A2P6NEV3_9EUKA|nr:hypothetical protein PROFUN_09734 [Planoprotostelium fungivorum]